MGSGGLCGRWPAPSAGHAHPGLRCWELWQRGARGVPWSSELPCPVRTCRSEMYRLIWLWAERCASCSPATSSALVASSAGQGGTARCRSSGRMRIAGPTAALQWHGTHPCRGPAAPASAPSATAAGAGSRAPGPRTRCAALHIGEAEQRRRRGVGRAGRARSRFRMSPLASSTSMPQPAAHLPRPARARVPDDRCTGTGWPAPWPARPAPAAPPSCWPAGCSPPAGGCGMGAAGAGRVSRGGPVGSCGRRLMCLTRPAARPLRAWFSLTSAARSSVTA